jgi:hypothetical protein
MLTFIIGSTLLRESSLRPGCHSRRRHPRHREGFPRRRQKHALHCQGTFQRLNRPCRVKELTSRQERELSDTHTIVSLGGKIDQKYVLVFSWTFKPRRTFQAKEGWPANPEENLERLKSCGFVSDRGIPKCDNCGKLVGYKSLKLIALQRRCNVSERVVSLNYLDVFSEV